MEEMKKDVDAFIQVANLIKAFVKISWFGRLLVASPNNTSRQDNLVFLMKAVPLLPCVCFAALNSDLHRI